jgi:lysophospholipase L1-like esterase
MKKRTFVRFICSLFLYSLLFIFVNDANAHSISAPASSPKNPSTPTVVRLVAFGDSNTTPYLSGTTSWFVYLEKIIRSRYSKYLYSFTFTNLAENATAITTVGGTHQYNIQAKLNLITYADYAFVLLGTNDAWQGADPAIFESDFHTFITTIRNSGKVGKLYILAVPPIIYPFNCLGDCWWSNPPGHNPQTERVIPFNTMLSSINSDYCAGIGYTCVYVNSNNGIQANSSYLNAPDGIHLLNNTQFIISNNIYAVLSQDTSIMQPSTTTTSTSRFPGKCKYPTFRRCS